MENFMIKEKERPLCLSLQPADLKRLDAWRRQQESLPTRQTAIRQILRQALPPQSEAVRAP
jgi:hypothetical protein